MQKFYSHPEPFTARRNGSRIVVENRYVRCVHDASCGGALAEAVIRYGSGKNLFAAPQFFALGTIDRNGYHMYHADKGDLSLSSHDGNPVAECRSPFIDDAGKVLDGVFLRLKAEYTPWGEVLFETAFEAAKQVDDLGMLQVGTLYPNASMDTLGLTGSLAEADQVYSANGIRRWISLGPRKKESGYMSRYLPLSAVAFRRGSDGFQVNLGDDLEEWESLGGVLPGSHMSFFCWRDAKKCYEFRYSVLDCLRHGQYLPQGETKFHFSLAFPFVREKMCPLVPCAGNILCLNRPFEKRWPEEAILQNLENAGATLMRFHNDGNSYNNGIFWRDAAYPPYPPEDMKKLDQLISDMHRHHLKLVPYISGHEYHPDAAGFRENAENWSRLVDPQDRMIETFGPNGCYGFQMCLKSGWLQRRKDTIEQILGNHAFDGLYYDWCIGMECRNPAHGSRHWDFRELISLLEWSKQRIGKEGELYLHLTHHPNITAENMATTVLTEESGTGYITPDMFSPHVHFMNMAPRQICNMLSRNATDADQLRNIMCALLHHATVSSMATEEVGSGFFAENRDLITEVTRYDRHTAPGEGLCFSSAPDTGSSAYWNHGGECMVFLVNLAEESRKTDYHFAAEGGVMEGSAELAPLSLKVLHGKLT